MGFLLLGFAAGSADGYRASLIYLFIYAVMNVGFLTIFLGARRTKGHKNLIFLTDFRGLGEKH